MSTEIDYTPEGKNKIEIEKLHAEVREMKSFFRRWLSAAGGILGLITAAVAIVISSNQFTASRSESALAEKKLAADKAKFDVERADLALAEAKKKEGEIDARLVLKNQEIAEAEQRARNAEKQRQEAENAYADIQAKAGAAKIEQDRLQKQLETQQNAVASISDQTIKLASKLKEQPGTHPEEAAATAIVDSTRNLIASEHARLVEDNHNARLFFFVLDPEQRNAVWKLEPPLRAAKFFIGNVIVFAGKREDTPVLRYFRDVDQPEAEKIRDTLLTLGLDHVRVSRVNDPDSAGTGRKFQIWLRKEDLRGP